MSINKINSPKENKTKMTASTLMRLAGLSAAVAGFSFIMVGLFHQVNVTDSVATATWVNVHIFAIVMGFLGLLGMTGLYARQVEKSGWLGLVGFALFTIWLGIIMAFSFVEAFILPQLVTLTPSYVGGVMGMFKGAASIVDLGALPTIWNLSGPMFILGQLLFGIATFRAAVLPRWAGALMALGAVMVPVGAILPPELESLVLLPAGLALSWMGAALFAERRGQLLEMALNRRTAELAPGKTA